MPMPAFRSATRHLRAQLDEVEAERPARLVQVEPVRVEVVRDVEIGSTVAVHVGEDGAEAVVGLRPVDSRLRRHLAEARMPVRRLAPR